MDSTDDECASEESEKKNTDKNSHKYKTEICKNYSSSSNNSCSYGDKCRFAHGSGELRNCYNAQKREEKCDSFWKDNVFTCPYKTRCIFVHY